MITTSYAGSDAIQYSCCGLGWGVAGDIAEESERYRWMGTSRYSFLKVCITLFGIYKLIV